MYPFNATPGYRPFSSLFGAVGEEDFDNRDGQMLIGFDTAGDIPAGLGPDAYEILSATVTIMHDGQVAFLYDNTQDSYVTFLDRGDEKFEEDGDPGRPLEIFGAGFRNGFDAETFLEDSPHGPLFGFGVRNAYALGFDDVGTPIDVSNNVREHFDPHPWAIGQIVDLEPGAVVPLNAAIVFEIDIENPWIQQDFRVGLADGRLRLTVTSLHEVEMQAGSFATIYNKEHPLVIDGLASAAMLQLTVEVSPPSNPADINGDGMVDVLDLLAVILEWGECVDPNDCPADVNADGAVDVNDLVLVVLAWG
jgi:hypothetical protein